MSNIFSENLKKSRLNSGMKVDEIASSLGVSQQTYYNYESGNREPSIENIVVLAKLFGVSADYLFGMTDDTDTKIAPQPSIKESTIKVFEKIPVNIEDIDAIPYAIDKMVISQEMAEDGNKYLGLLVQDNAMFSEYYDGDIVIVKPGNDMQNGDDVVVSVGNNDAKIRRIQKMSGGIRLKTLNPAYESEYFSNEDIEKLPVSIIGTIVEMRRIKK